MRAVDPDTWKHVKKIEIVTRVPSNRAAIESKTQTKANTTKPSEVRNTWRAFFRLLGPLTVLTISINDCSESPEAAHGIVASPWWLDYTSLLRDNEQLSDLILSSKLLLKVTCSRHNHAYSDFIHRLLQPLTAYEDTNVQIKLAKEKTDITQAGAVQLASLLGGQWVKNMHVDVGRRIGLAAPFTNITSLSIHLKQDKVKAAFWDHIDRLSPALQKLYIEEIDLSEIMRTPMRKLSRCQTSKSFPQLALAF